MATTNTVSLSKNVTSVQMEEYLTSLSWEKMAELSPSIAFLSVLIILGVPGNTLIFFIYWRYFKASSTRVFVLSMAVVDLLTSALSCSSLIIEVCFLYTFVHPHACQAMFIIARLPVVTSGWLLVFVALDRRHRICQPLRRHMSPRQALYLVLVSVALASATTFPFFPLRNIVMVKTDKDHVLGKRCDITVEFSSPQLKTAESLTLMLTLIFGLLLMISSYVHIGYKLHRQKSRNQMAPHTERQDQKRELKESEVPIKIVENDISTVMSTTSTSHGLIVKASATSEAVETTTVPPTVESTGPSKQDGCTATVSVGSDGKTTKVSTRGHVGKKIPSRTTLMMFVLTVTAIVSYVPYVIISNLDDDEWGGCLEKTGWEMNSCMIALLFVNVNSIVNPFIYSFCNPTFRAKCRHIFCSVRQRFSG
ncbi:cholecystokinin receptor type A-like [Pomacea canaliculata]|uniref:cholecystokinin receptor type A-like n=1 Tax=Pomacea canaliculata TaxID=400727 RepID=UPI000D73BEAD|nr:cholecystokinin receptor type A-like [Pomacea canaliculata]